MERGLECRIFLTPEIKAGCNSNRDGELPLDPPVPHFIIQHLKPHPVPIVASPALCSDDYQFFITMLFQ
ncbi:MAG: hypothetical protein N2V77_04160, partial [Canidatus Methanoxibalbensis ujae]|nr:hypothetical protein [Candidatus Methanoxibalbensis ujae]